MTVLFRADASAEIGTGHIMRCLALAAAVKQLGQTCVFACRQLPKALADRIKSDGHTVQCLVPAESTNADKADVIPYAHWLTASWQDDAVDTVEIADEEGATWIVVDHYGLDADWERAVATNDRRVVVLDDLADRKHHAQILVDPSLYETPHTRYRNLIAPGAQMLLGPRYAALRDEFVAAAPRALTPADAPICFLIAFGGVDAAGMTRIAVEALAGCLQPDDTVQVVVGGAHAGRAAIATRCDELGWACDVNSNRMSALMAAADIAIGAGGSMVWERMAMGLPSIAVIVAENQHEQVTEAARRGLLIGVEATGLDAAALRGYITALRADADGRKAMSVSNRRRVDGRGAQRIARRIIDQAVTFRVATTDDSKSLLAWRNDERIRLVSHDTSIISVADHDRWLAGTLANPRRYLLIGEDATGPLGVVRFDRSRLGAEVSIYLAPDRLGSGLGANLLLAAEAQLHAKWPCVSEIQADVLPANGASNELFLSCGYRFGSGFYRKPIGSAA